MEEKIIEFLKENPNPSDDELHDWAESEGLDVHEVETAIYALATKFVNLLTGGKSGGERPEGATDEQIQKGVKVELEHTSDRDVAEKIVYDHMVESLDYYDALAEMEKGLEKESSLTVDEVISAYLDRTPSEQEREVAEARFRAEAALQSEVNPSVRAVRGSSYRRKVAARAKELLENGDGQLPYPHARSASLAWERAEEDVLRERLSELEEDL